MGLDSPAAASSQPEGRRASRIVLAPRSSLEVTELRQLLHRRLKQLCALGAVSLAGILVLWISIGVQFHRYVEILIANMLMSAGFIFLSRKRNLPLEILRAIEIFLLAIASLSMAYIWTQIADNRFVAMDSRVRFASETGDLRGNQFFVFPDGTLFARAAFPLLANAIGLSWSMVAVFYAVFIPNTWRRCAIVMLAAILSAAGCAAYLLWRVPGMRIFTPHIMLQSIFVVSMFAAVGIYGTHKLEVLRTKAVAAQEVGQYRLMQRLGKGGMGEVYLAQHRLLRRPCAVKLIRLEQADDAATLLRFEREVQAMAQLTHPNIVEIYDYGRTDDGTFYYAMEYLPGLSADALVQRHGPLSSGRVIHFLQQVCGALDEAHAAGMIHRDIKPANLIICQRGRTQDVVKLLDFGLVQVADELGVLPAPAATNAASTDSRATKLTLAGHILGTPAYLSPEQARGEPADARSDIYSTGAVAYYLLSGKPPFVHPTVSQLLEAHEKETPRPLAGHGRQLDSELAAVVMKCLEKAPAARYQNIQELAAALAACSSAGSWGPAQAAHWWQAHASAHATSPQAPEDSSANNTVDSSGSRA